MNADIIDRINYIVNLQSLPDYLLLSVDNSNSMVTSDIEPGYSIADPNFLGWIGTHYPATDVSEIEFDSPARENWINEITTAIQNLLDELWLE